MPPGGFRIGTCRTHVQYPHTLRGFRLRGWPVHARRSQPAVLELLFCSAWYILSWEENVHTLYIHNGNRYSRPHQMYIQCMYILKCTLRNFNRTSDIIWDSVRGGLATVEMVPYQAHMYILPPYQFW